VHTNVRRFIKTGIVFLFAGLLIGAWMLVQRELGGAWPGPYLVSAHAHAVQLGFVMFLILGVALWLFPKPPEGDTRYRPARIDLAYWTLTIATAVRILGEVARGLAGPAWLGWIVTAAGVAQVAGFAIYFWTMWPRIRPVGSHLREAKGERF
jgi:heme/copper-type cytochrome/quinol oxidase subunit 1